MSRSYMGCVCLVSLLTACGSNPSGSADAALVFDAQVQADAAVVYDAAVPDATVPDASVVDGAVDAMVLDAGPLAMGVTTLAGSGVTGELDGFRGGAQFNNPANVAVAADGTIYVADFDNGSIRAVTEFGDVTTLTDQAGFARPFGLVPSASGVLYVQTDRNSSLVNGGALWSINTTTGLATLLFDNIGRCRGMTELQDGRLALAFYQDHVIKVYDPSTPTVAPVVVAGTMGTPGMVDDTGAAARFNLPYDLVTVSATEVVVSDQGNHRLRLINVTTGVVSTFAGDGTAASNDGALLAAQFNVPQGMTVDNVGTIYVSDMNGYVLRRVSGGNVTTVAGDGTAGYMDSTSPLSAKFWGLEGIAVRGDGAFLYIADGNRGEVDPYNRVRRLTLQ